MTQRQGIYQDIYWGLKSGVLTGCPSASAPNSRFDGIMFLAGSRMYGTCL
jgi:hypothetical protein